MKRNRRNKRALFTLQRQYKIGISNRPKRRTATVNKAVSGGVRLACQYPFMNAMKTEQRLHRAFADSRHTLKWARKGAGKTEWFYLSLVEYLALRLMLLFLWVRIPLTVLIITILCLELV